MDSSTPFELAAELRGHDGSVRTVCVLGGELGGQQQLISGGDDGTVKRWLRADTESHVVFECIDTITEAEHWVLALLPLPPGVVSEAPQGGFIAASQDKAIRVYDREGVRLRLLLGHQHGVTSLSWTAGGQLVSGSWDGTAKVWNVETSELLLTLGEHENGVCVVGLPNGDIATGSTGREEGGKIVDIQIRIWREGKVVKAVREHTGPVRSLVVWPDVGFLSTSNDGSVRLHSFQGEPISFLQAPPGPDGDLPFIYRAAPFLGPGGVMETAAAGEDGALNIWRGETLIQCIQHPRGLWTVHSSGSPAGELVTGCQDGAIRVFTRDVDKQGPEELRVAFAQAGKQSLERQAQGGPGGGPSAEEIASLPPWEDRHAQHGKKEGTIQLFRKAGTAIAASWSAESQTWIEIGEVMGSSNTGSINGVVYDHVFPIEIEQPGGAGVQNLQIGYNNNQNPFQAAQTFIDAHMLPQRHLTEIADYIAQRAGHAAPIIGGGAAVPSASASSASTATTFTGQPPSLPPPPTTSRYFPKVGYVVFDAGQLDKILGKILEFSKDPAFTSLPFDYAALSSLVATLQASSRYHASQVKESEMKALFSLLYSWPADKIFPLLDLLRMAVLHPSLKADGFTPSQLAHIISLCEDNPASAPVAMLTLRLLANLCRHSGTRKLLVATLPSSPSSPSPSLIQALSLAARHAASTSKSVRGAAAALLLNLSVLLSSEIDFPPSSPPPPSAVTAVVNPGISSLLAGEGGKEEDAALKATVALGTLLSTSSTKATAKPAALSIKNELEGLAALGGTVKECLEDLTKVM